MQPLPLGGFYIPCCRLFSKQPPHVANPTEGSRRPDGIAVPHERNVEPFLQGGGQSLQAVGRLTPSAQDNGRLSPRQVRQLPERHEARELSDDTDADPFQDLRHLAGVTTPRAAAVPQEHSRSRLLLAGTEKSVHKLRRHFQIAFVIFAVQKSEGAHRKDGNAVGRFHFPSGAFHVVTDNTGHAGVGDDNALRMIRVDNIGEALLQFVHAAENGFPFAQLNRHEGDRLRLAAPAFGTG